jgi:glycerophosphoryl diester phosphodiesterase
MKTTKTNQFSLPPFPSWTYTLEMAVVAVVFLSLVAGCDKRPQDPSSVSFDLEGHRGARGLLPENSIPAFVRALDLGVTTVELDVVLSADGDVVVSHDPWFSSLICSHPDGRPVSKEEEKDLILFSMSYREIAGYDCGSRGHPGFPDQRPVATTKPLLKDVILASEEHADSTGRSPVLYNIEIKSSPERDGVYYSSVEVYARGLYNVLVAEDLLDRSLVQSFDPRALEAIRAIDSEIPLALLVNNELGLSENLSRLTFSPDVYSPNKRLVDGKLVAEAHRKRIRVIPWTVNDVVLMKELMDLGVDGLITDYPDRGSALLAELPE